MLPRVFRPPYGDEDSRVRSAIAGLGYRDVLWDIDPIDWDARRSPERITSIILQRAKARRIVLTHVEPHTLQALPAIVEGLRQRGLTPAPVAAIAGGNG
jgi:peptidoglycan/xylan/chitin deacetylase (PgdA/CDA1 family)